MIQALVLGVISFIAIYIAISQIENLKQIHKVLILLFSLLLFALFAYIEEENQSHREKIIEVKRAFNTGKTLVCGDFNVTKEEFTITSNSFLAKKESVEFGLIVPLIECFDEEK